MNLRIAAFSALALVVSGSLSLDACERCQSGAKQRCECQRNNDGLLFRLDALTGKFHSSMRGAADSLTGLSQPKKGCDHKSGCACGQTTRGGPEPTCGCEHAPACGCEARLSHPVQPHMNHAPGQPLQPTGDYWAPQPIPTPTPVPSQPKMSPEQPLVPAPLPDTQVDPFRDEAVRNGRGVRARSIQYRKPAAGNPQSTSERPRKANYGSLYDDQASASGPHTFDHVATPIRITDAVPGRQQAFTPAVIPASAQQPPKLPSTSTKTTRLPSLPIRVATPLRNPLR